MPEPRSLIKKHKPVADKGLRDRAGVLLLAGEIEAGDNTGVLVEAGALWESSQGGFDAAHANVQILIGAALGVDAFQREQAPVSAAFEGEDASADKVREWHNTGRCSRFGEPRCTICVGHSSSSASGSKTRVETSWGACERQAMLQATTQES
jgi:hypothetical protein